MNKTTNLYAADALAGKVAVVTGGSSGIGLATADLLLAAGAAVAICGRNPERLNEAAQQLIDKHGAERIYAAPCDVLDTKSTQDFAKAVEEKLGSVSMLINNAGQGRVSTFADTTDEAWIEELNLKFFSIINPTRAFLPQLKEQAKKFGDAAVVCTNSLLARQPEPHMVATSAARAGILNLVRSLATEFAPDGVRVNGILVGLIDSAQWRRRYENRENKAQSWEQWSNQLALEKKIPMSRLGEPLEAAQAILFLASPLASYTTGSHIDISGGHSRHA